MDPPCHTSSLEMKLSNSEAISYVHLEGKKNIIEEKFFNYCLCLAWQYIECTFGILNNKWQIFHRPLNVKTDFTEDITKACVMLHNFVCETDGYNFYHTLYVEGLHKILTSVVKSSGKYVNDVHEHFASSFQRSVGAVPLQYRKTEVCLHNPPLCIKQIS